MNLIYLTHCSNQKDDSLRKGHKKVTPDKLYREKFIKKFMEKCKKEKVNWAIFSDKYGVWFPDKKRSWYDKPPESVDDKEFRNLAADIENKLKDYKRIYFYKDKVKFHPFYIEIFNSTKISEKVEFFSELSMIGNI